MNAINTKSNTPVPPQVVIRPTTATPPYDIRLRAYGILNTKTEVEVKEFLETTVRELTIGTLVSIRIKPYKKNKYTQFHKVDFGVIFNNASARGKSQSKYLNAGKRIVRPLDDKQIIIRAYIPKYKPPQAELHTIVPDSDAFDSDLEILYSNRSYFKAKRDEINYKMNANTEMARASMPTAELDPKYANVESMTREEMMALIEAKRPQSAGPVSLREAKAPRRSQATSPPRENMKKI